MTVARISVMSPAALDELLAVEREYWLDKLGAGVEPCGLPLDFRRRAVAAPRDGRLSVTARGDTAARALALTGGNRSLVFCLLLAALKACLARYNDRRDVVVGTAIHQDHAEVASVNRLLALRTPVHPEVPVRELLQAVKTTFAEAVEHQKFPFDRVLDLLGVEAPRHRGPLFDVVATLDGLHAREHVERVAADLAVAFHLRGDALGFDLSWRSDLLRRRTIEIFAEHLEHLLAQMVERPEAPVGSLHLVDEQRRRRLVAEAAGPRREVPRRSMPELFAEAAAARPHAIAVSCEGRDVTFAELDRESAAGAAELLRRGVRRGEPVAVAMGRTAELVTAALAVLRAGAVFLPLDPEHPPSRLRLVTGDAGARLLLAGPDAPRLDMPGLVELAWEEVRGAAGGAAAQPPPAPEEVAYLIYTSGSTGRPKGVAVSHHALVDYLGWAHEVYLRGEPATFGLYTSPAFDLTVTSLLLPLICGGRLVVYPDPAVDVMQVLDDDQVEVVKVTPSHLALLRDRDCRGSRVRRLIVGGEAFEVSLAREVHERFGGAVEIYNEYGPTEATVGCMIHRFDPTADRRSFVPIGHPAANARVHLLDATLAPVAENVVGEMYLGGDGLALGYAGRPALTASRFVPDPWGEGERLYRTGDLARRLPEGGLEFLGRGDDQVKFHGYRVELNELRCALNEHPAVRDSVVRLAGDGEGEVLVAYYASRQAVAPETLRDFLAERLIEATIPNLFVHLRKLPLTLNGKVNLASLPSLDEARDRLRRVYVAPRTATETMLARVWSEVLGVERVGVHDSFFELGGHSLLATRVVSRLRAELGSEVPMARLFQSRTLSAFAEAVDELRRSGEAAGALPPVAPVPRPEDGLPLSYAQQRLWVLDRLEPGTSGYNILSALGLDGELDPRLLARTLDDLVRRHEGLRTVFRATDGEPRQHVRDAMALPLRRLDLGSLPRSRRQGALERAMRRENGHSFDLSRGPLVRALLVRLEPRRHALLLTMHHVVSDGWSLSLLVDELVRLYASGARGEAASLPPLPIQYADFAAWQRRHLQGERLAAHVEHWRRRLDGVEALDLPTDRPRPAMQSFRGGSRSITLPPRLAARLKALADAEGTTLFAVLLAGFEALLSRWAGQRRFSVGTFIAGRNRAELEGLVGFFVNNLVLVADLRGGPSFRELVRRARRDSLDAFAHQDLPFEKLLDELDVPRDLSRTPLFQTMFVFQNLPRPGLSTPGLEVSVLPLAVRRSNFDLTLWMYETGDGLRASFHYAADLFDGSTVDGALERLTAILERAAADPDRPVAELTAAGPAPAAALRVWSVGPEPRGEGAVAVHQRVAERAAADPAAPAVFDGERVLTYGELELRSRVLARRLRAAGAGAESPVAVLLARSPELVVALLGVLRCGAFYVPLDPDLPPPRRDAVLSELGVRLAVAADGGGLDVVTVPSLAEAAAEAEAARPAPEVAVDPDQLAYAIHTSGSSGRPKGVGVPHRSLAAYIDELVALTGIGAGDRVLQFAAPSFDTAAEEIFSALTAGAALVLRDAEMLASVPGFLAACGERGVTVLDLPTVFWNQAMGSDELELPPSVRLVIIGGERALPDRWSAWRERVGDRVRLLNTYGPTEATIVKTVAELTGERAGGEAPIGRPLAGAAAWVVGEDGALAPAGVPGELWLGGGLARGYLGRPGATAAAFVPDAFGGAAGARLYRTGDLARWRPDGALAFLGRIDHQVKVRGFRVELGEVEAALAAHPAVGDAVAGLADLTAGPAQLVAWVTAAGGAHPDPAELRADLQRRLPDYLVPAVVQVLDRLPMTVSGKVDRRALPKPDGVRAGAGVRVPPRTPEEEAMAQIWMPLLGLDSIGVFDNFFDLGGHSLLATQIVARVRKSMGVEVPLRRFFEAPTVAELTLVVEDVLIEELEGLSDEEAELLLAAEERAVGE